jgi:hypothetical protein
MAMMKCRFSLRVIGFLVGAALSYRAALLAEGLAVYRGWRAPGLLVFFHLLPLIHRGGEPPFVGFGFRIVVDMLILCSMICALVLLMSKVYRFYNS